MEDRLPSWPKVPACYGWLSLDARGRWRLQDETISHPGLIAFLDANYTRDTDGSWLVHNGPQRVYVRLESAPWVVRLQPDKHFLTHSGRQVDIKDALWLDGDGRVFMDTDAGPASLDDRDLATLLADVCDASGEAANEDELLALMSTSAAADPDSPSESARLQWHGVPVLSLKHEQAAAHFGFVADPTPADPART